MKNKIEFSISELHFIKNTIYARIKWIEDNPDDWADEGELENLQNIFNKLQQINFTLEKKDE